MRYKSTTSWKLNHICLGGPVKFVCYLTSLHCTRRMGASGNCACASSRSLSASSAPAFQTGPSTTQNMGVLEMPLLWRMMTYVKSYQMHSKWNGNCNTCPCLQTNSYHWKKNCAGSLLDSVGYSHLNLLRMGSKDLAACLQLLHSSPKTRDLARHTQNTP